MSRPVNEAQALPVISQVGFRSHRLFLSLWPDDGARAQLVAHAKQWVWPTGCVTYAPADWHVTLHFIGNVDADRAADIAAAVAVEVAPQPFELTMDQPEVCQHGLAVLLASEVSMPLQALYDRLGNVLRRLDLPLESRPYLPHVTLARRAASVIAPKAFAPVIWSVRSFALVLSTGDKEGRYRVIRQYR
jgi:2'-5' RNA ligase